MYQRPRTFIQDGSEQGITLAAGSVTVIVRLHLRHWGNIVLKARLLLRKQKGTAQVLRQKGQGRMRFCTNAAKPSSALARFFFLSSWRLATSAEAWSG